MKMKTNTLRASVVARKDTKNVFFMAEKYYTFSNEKFLKIIRIGMADINKTPYRRSKVSVNFFAEL